MNLPTDLDPHAMATLYARHVQEAVRLAYFLAGEKGLAEDLAQDAFMKTFGRFHHLRDEQAFRPYLHRTIVNLSRKQFRRRRVERTFLQRERSVPEAATGGVPDLETRDELWRALYTLPGRQRTALVLRYYTDLSEEQTADVMRCSRAAVNSLVARGLASLRQQVEGGDG